jgi:hypothetical protein
MKSKSLSNMGAGGLYCFVHFTVDAACFYFLFARLSAHPMLAALALFYDALAFPTQSLFGILADRFPRFNGGLVGSLMIAAALMLPWSLPALILVGLGNALAHIDGARHTLCGADGKIAPCGIYVSGGSVGVITGQLMARTCSVALPLGLILLSALLTLWLAHKHIPVRTDANGFHLHAGHSLSMIVLLAFVAVAVRAYIGFAIPTGWNQTTVHAVLLYISMAAGKLTGGLLCDRIGFRKTTALSIGLSLPLLLLGDSAMVLSLIGIGLFSMTMPVTVALLVSALPEEPCFAFGITTVALFVGTVPAFFIRPETLLAHQITVLLLSVLAAGCLHRTLKKGC